MNDKRLSFGENVENYDQWRPGYSRELYDDIYSYSHITDQFRIIEIGCGTGQATAKFLSDGYFVQAIEISETMCAYVAQKFSDYPNFKVSQGAFEEYALKENSADLIYSATAFHWINQEVGFSKIHQILKPGGSLALFWNHPFVGREDDPLHQRIQTIYNKYGELGYREKCGKPKEIDASIFNCMCEKIRNHGFREVECKIYRRVREFTAEEYVKLLNTYSDHRAMEETARINFEEEIAEAIRESGGKLQVYDTMDLYLGKNVKKQ